MRYICSFLFTLTTAAGFSQNLQLLYDFRHTIDPGLNPSGNYPILSFEYFRNTDTTDSGAFMVKIQSDLKGEKYNIGQTFIQLTRSFRFWKPKIFLSFNYNGGLGVTPELYGYYISNSLAAGLAYTRANKDAWFSSSLYCRYNAFDKPSIDPQLSFYFGRGFFYYKLYITGGFVFWTQNRNQGNEYTRDLSGKKFAFFGDPQIWYRFYKGISVGSKVNVYHHLITQENSVQFYPSIGAKFQF